MSTIQLNIRGMHCGACVKRVKAAVEKIPNAFIEEVSVGKVVLSARPPDAEQVEAVRKAAENAIRAIGFEVEGAS